MTCFSIGSKIDRNFEIVLIDNQAILMNRISFEDFLVNRNNSTWISFENYFSKKNDSFNILDRYFGAIGKRNYFFWNARGGYQKIAFLPQNDFYTLSFEISR